MAPKDGPTTSDWIISAAAGNLPALKTLAKSLVSATSKLPVISDLPPEIGPEVTPGAEYTTLSKAIAIQLFCVKALPVNSSQTLAPAPFICIETAGLPIWSNVSLASTITPPLIGAILSLLPFRAYKPTDSVSFLVFSSTLTSGLPQANFAYRLSAGNKLRISGLLK